MTFEDLRLAAAAVPKRSRPLQRRLRLLQSVLSRMPGAVTHASNAAKRYDREFWTNFLSPCVIMELAQWRFDLLNDAHNDLVRDVLQGLEEVVQVASRDIPEEYKATPFPRLESLSKVISESSESDKIRIQLAKPNDADGFVELMNNLAAVMRDDRNKSNLSPETAQVSSKAKPLLAPLILNLFSTLSKYWRCTRVCRDSHQAALALFTNRAYPADDNASASFTVLLSKSMSSSSKPVIRWLEASITVREPLPKATVRIALPELKPRQFAPVIDLCTITKRPNTRRIKLNIDGNLLFRHDDTDVRMTAFQDCEPVSFSKGFLENAAELGFEGKICLALVLSFSFLDFCGRPWFPRGWTKDNLYLMQNGDNLSLQPFLVTNMRSEKRQPSTKGPVEIWDAKLLDHGILLMEIFQQDSLRQGLKQPGKDPTDQKYIAKAWFESIKWDVCEQYARAVDACINGLLIDNLHTSWRLTAHNVDGPLGSQPPTPAETLDEIFARMFYDAILAPLEADFASQWPNQDPDQAISTLKLPHVGRLRSSPSCQAGSSNGVSRKTGTPWAPRLPYRKTQPQPRQPTSLSRPAKGEIDEGRFFDTSSSPDNAEIKSALSWFGYFDTIKDRLPAKAASNKKQIRIGVLDTGIDLKNTWISQRLGRIRCWPSGAECHDNDGHGTHVAHLLLRMTKHADLRICKVTNSTYIKDADIKKIADAISHFSRPGEDHVDILTLSFGFPRYDDVLEPIKNAIRNARNHGVIIFAAAGNEGGNAGVFWPASLHETGDVIRINTSDGKGSPSSFNPSPEIGRWICTLGQGVPSCEIRVPPGPDAEPQIVYRSGSSFATPIAAAIAAIILGIMDRVDVSQYPKDLVILRPRLRTRLGMEKVLCETCVQQMGYKRSDHFYITPWHFFEVGEQTQVHVILKILMHVPP